MRELKRRLLRALDRGIKLPGKGVRMRVVLESTSEPPDQGAAHLLIPVVTEQPARERDAASAVAEAIIRAHIEVLARRCPPLARFSHASIETNAADAQAFLTFCNNTVAIFDTESTEAHLRRQLVTLRGQLGPGAFADHVGRMIAESDLRSGVVERAGSLHEDPELSAELKAQIAEFDSHYGADPPFLGVSVTILNFEGDLRGRSLRWFFSQNEALLRGRRILHVAPEETLQEWLQAKAGALGATYATIDGFSTDADHRCDLTALPFTTGSYDAIICHRVLEHILDDAAAFSEMYRILAPGGWLDFSVPQSTNLPMTKEWLVQDSSHHDHVRQYGRDLEQRIEAAGFSVDVDRSLLTRPLPDHKRDGTYPMRHYLCRKAGKFQPQA